MRGQNPKRAEVLKKIEELERLGRFDQDVEPDPPSIPLLPGQMDYLGRDPLRPLAYGMAWGYYGYLRFRGRFVMEPPEGLEHLRSVRGGAVITCNHFHPTDSLAAELVFRRSGHPGQLWRVIREGNYTNFPGAAGFLMRHCRTLPLSSHPDTMKQFLQAADTLLRRGECILIYPEQSMWWNYRKPKPMKSGAFDIAIRSGVPVVPMFITMADTSRPDPDGYPVQRLTAHLGPPIYPEGAPKSAERARMKAAAEEFCRKIYCQVYKSDPFYPS